MDKSLEGLEIDDKKAMQDAIDLMEKDRATLGKYYEFVGTDLSPSRDLPDILTDGASAYEPER